MVMNCAMESGPCAAMSEAMRGSEARSRRRRLRRLLAQGEPEEDRAGDPQRNRQRHAHAEPADELRVGIAEELDEEAERSRNR